MSYTNRKKNDKAIKLLIYVFIIALIASVAFVFLSPTFEKNKPKTSLENEIFWNLKTPLKVNFSDDNEIKSYVITYNDGKKNVILDTKIISKSKGSLDLNIIAPKADIMYQPKEVILKLEVFDTSKWNFFKGNSLVKEIKVKVDKVRPVANVISNSYLIRQGGSAIVIAEIKDENLKDFYVSFNNTDRFELIPFYKKNFYFAIIAWPIVRDTFESVNLVAIDEARNETITKVPLYIKSLKQKVDDIKISEKFIDKVSKHVLKKSGYELPDDNSEIFIKENRDLREQNVITIKEVVTNYMNKDKISKFKLKAFRRLSSGKKFAGFGERRHYFYDNEKIDEAWHLGMDWASVKKAKIFTTNAGKVIYNDYLGIYGNTIIIDHNYGLSSLYAHTSRSSVDLNDNVRAGQQIANTGSTGAVFGDHLHFGVLVQGIEVNPKEWMDKNWIKVNVINTIAKAKKVIDSK